MFSFFRKHQRFFYSSTALFVAMSLISFGTWRSSAKGDERHLFKTPGKQRHEKKELLALECFLAREAMEGNPLNDGVISSDFLKNGLADGLVSHFKEQIGTDLIAALPRELRWRPYLHPQLPALHQKMFWHYFCPSLATHYESFSSFSKAGDVAKLFAVKRDLCLAQSELPAEQVRRAILEQSSARNIDVHIAPGDLELFGYRDYSQWFGPQFMRLAAQVILLGAEEAQKLGAAVSHQEAKADLIAAAARLQRQYSGPDSQVNKGGEIAEFYQLCRQLTKLSEKELLVCWRHILLFRHFVSARQQAWGLDASLPIAFDDFANREKKAIFYTLDDSMYIDTPDQWERFEVYCRIVSRDIQSDGGFPQQCKEPSQLWKIAPQLLQSPCRANHLTVKKSHLRAQIPQRRITQWLLAHENWKKVRASVPAIGPAETLEIRSSIIESLKSEDRDRLDQMARAILFDQDPEILEHALQQPKSDIEWMFNGAGLSSPFSSIKRPGEFAELIKKAWDLDPNAARALLHYEADDDTIISLSIINTPKWEIAPWSKALAKGWIEEVMKSQRPAKCGAADVTKAKLKFQELARAANKPHAWLNWRALKMTELALEQLRTGTSLSSVLPEDALTFSNQWLLRKEIKQISKKSFEAEKWPSLFADELAPMGWSKSQWEQKPLGFYQIIASHRPFEEDESIPAIDPQLVCGAERARQLIAKQLDREFANQWLESQIGNLRALPMQKAGFENGESCD